MTRAPRLAARLCLAFGLALGLASCAGLSARRTSIPAGLQTSIQILQISDIHFRPRAPGNKKLLALINKENPDLILLTGDLVDNAKNVDPFLDWLAKLTADCPIYAILGNHEYQRSINRLEFKHRLADLGIKLLINEAETLTIKDSRLYIFGLDDYVFGRPRLYRIRPPDDAFPIILAHCPIFFEPLSALGFGAERPALILSGHTHAGQITFFGIPLYKPRGSGRFLKGLYREKKLYMLVSSGAGTSSLHIRVCAPAAIEILELSSRP